MAPEARSVVPCQCFAASQDVTTPIDVLASNLIVGGPVSGRLRRHDLSCLPMFCSLPRCHDPDRRSCENLIVGGPGAAESYLRSEVPKYLRYLNTSVTKNLSAAYLTRPAPRYPRCGELLLILLSVGMGHARRGDHNDAANSNNDNRDNGNNSPHP